MLYSAGLAKEILSHDHGNFEEKNKVLGSPAIIINYSITDITNAYWN